MNETTKTNCNHKSGRWAHRVVKTGSHRFAGDREQHIYPIELYNEIQTSLHRPYKVSHRVYSCMSVRLGREKEDGLYLDTIMIKSSKLVGSGF